MRRIVVLVCVLGAAALACMSCNLQGTAPDAGDAGDAPSSGNVKFTEQETIVVPWAHAVDGRELKGVEVHPNRLVFESDSARRSAESYRRLDILASGNAGKPFLRRVTGIERKSNRTVLETEPATLTEAIYKTDFSTESAGSEGSDNETRRQNLQKSFDPTTKNINISTGQLQASGKPTVDVDLDPVFELEIDPGNDSSPEDAVFHGTRSCSTRSDCYQDEVCRDAKCSYEGYERKFSESGVTACDLLTEKLQAAREHPKCRRKWEEYWKGERDRSNAWCTDPPEGVTGTTNAYKAPPLAQIEWAKENCHGALRTFEFNMRGNITAGIKDVQISAQRNVKKAGSLPVAPTKSWDRLVFVSWLPVLLTYQYEPGLSYEFGAGASGTVQGSGFGLKSSTLEAGVHYYADGPARSAGQFGGPEYHDGNASPSAGDWHVHGYSQVNWFDSSFSGEIRAGVRASVTHDFRLLLYRTIGPYLELTAPNAQVGFRGGYDFGGSGGSAAKYCTLGARFGLGLSGGVRAQAPFCAACFSKDFGMTFWTSCKSGGFCGEEGPACVKECFSEDCGDPIEKPEDCSNDKDDDGDGLVDCADSDCPVDGKVCTRCDYKGLSTGVCSNSVKPVGEPQCPKPPSYESPESSCDNKDNDCDGTTDEAGAANTCYTDADGDSYGSGVDGYYCTRCAKVPGAVSKGGDCVDSNANIHPGAAPKEMASGCYKDSDGDDYGDVSPSNPAVDAGTDCNDSNASVHPGATESCNNIDDDCDGQTDQQWGDQDGDGYVPCAGDCNDLNAQIYPGAPETCNGVDDDCDGKTDENVKNTYYRDNDGDGYGVSTSTTKACSAPGGYASQSGDCDDGDSGRNPGETETCNGKDDDCDGKTDENVKNTYYRDNDGDGYGVSTSTTEACSTPAGYTSVTGDCDDGDPGKNPGETETCNGKDDDCDGRTDENVKTTYYFDGDGDGYGVSGSTTKACSTPNGYASQPGDCNDSDSSINPGAYECCNSVDENCDGKLDGPQADKSCQNNTACITCTTNGKCVDQKKSCGSSC